MKVRLVLTGQLTARNIFHLNESILVDISISENRKALFYCTLNITDFVITKHEIEVFVRFQWLKSWLNNLQTHSHVGHYIQINNTLNYFLKTLSI